MAQLNATQVNGQLTVTTDSIDNSVITSNGVDKANKVKIIEKDGTSSYYSLQFDSTTGILTFSK